MALRVALHGVGGIAIYDGTCSAFSRNTVCDHSISLCTVPQDSAFQSQCEPLLNLDYSIISCFKSTEFFSVLLRLTVHMSNSLSSKLLKVPC